MIHPARDGDATPKWFQGLPPPEPKDGELWYEDGSLIVIWGNIAFRIYQGVLSSVSPVLKAMLSLPQPQDAQTA